MHRHIAVKFIAVFLCALALLTAVSSGIGIYLVAEQGLYGTDVADIQDKQLRSNLHTLADDLALRYAAQAYSNCPQALIDSYVGSYYLEELLEEGRWYYTLEDMTGQLLDSSSFSTAETVHRFEFAITPEYPVVLSTSGQSGLTFDPEFFFSDDPTEPTLSQEEMLAEGKPIFQEQIPYSWSDENGDHRYTLGIYKRGTYLVTIYLLEGAYEYQDSLQWQILDIAQQYRYPLMVFLAVGLMVFAICTVYLCAVAARLPGVDEKRAGGLNRLPLDLYLLLICAIGLLLWQIIESLIRWITDPSYLLPGLSAIGLCGFAASLLFVGFWFAAAAQCKTRIGWRNTLVIRAAKLLIRLGKPFGSWLRKKLRRLRQLLPVTWQWLTVGIVLLAALIGSFLLKNVWLTVTCSVLFLLAIVYTGYAFGVLMDGTRKMSRGDLQYRIGGKWLHGLFLDFSTYLSDLANVAVVAAKKQSRSERMKAELITNVSHDIKTPLTSIINYVDLLQKAGSQKEAREYLEVLDRQSLRLKKLIDDLMEMSKASTGNMTVEPVTLDAVESVNQALGEFSDKLEARGLTAVFVPPREPVTMLADGRLTWRVLSNLLSNAVKYAMPGTRVYLDVVPLEGNVLLSIKNISAQPLNISSEELMERFVRGDTSRNTEGSGLGLNIAKSLMELQKGQLHLLVDGDLFKATLIFPQGKPDGQS